MKSCTFLLLAQHLTLHSWVWKFTAYVQRKCVSWLNEELPSEQGLPVTELLLNNLVVYVCDSVTGFIQNVI